MATVTIGPEARVFAQRRRGLAAMATTPGDGDPDLQHKPQHEHQHERLDEHRHDRRGERRDRRTERRESPPSRGPRPDHGKG